MTFTTEESKRHPMTEGGQPLASAASNTDDTDKQCLFSRKWGGLFSFPSVSDGDFHTDGLH